jgi:precorrin-2 dehydrogenase/sirohydrochlorin ferrochelatase
VGLLINLVLDGRRAVVVGGGMMASRRAEDLLLAGAAVTVVASEPGEEIRAYAAGGRIAGCWRAYKSGDLDGAWVAVAATADEAVNAQVAADAGRLGILVNVVDRPALCTFTMPALVRRGDLAIGVATAGRCPSMASLLREEIEARYGPEYAGVLEELALLRSRLIEQGCDGREIREAVARRFRELLPPVSKTAG